MGSLTGVLAVSGLTGCSWQETKQAKESGRTPAQFSSDKATTRRVEEELKTGPVYKFPEVKVETFNGVVQLSGFVHTDDQKQAAAEIARKVPGVDKVLNGIALVQERMEPTGRTDQSNQPGQQKAPVVNSQP